MTDVDFNMMPVSEARRRVWHARRDKAQDIAAATDLKLSVHVSMQALEADWRALEASSAASLHQGFDWCAAWAKTHPNQLLLVRGSIGQKTVFILPLELVRGRFFRTARFIGSPHSNLNTGLFAADFDPLTCEQLGASLIADLSAKLSRVADIVTLEKMPFDWHGTCHPLASLPAVRNQNSSFQLPLLASFEATLAQINAKRRRKKFRVSEKRLEALGGYEHVVATTRRDRRQILDLFFEQKAIRFKALGLPNVFQDRETQAFFHTLAAVEPTAEGQPLELNAIRLRGEQNGRIVAIAGLSRKGDHVICQFGSIDEEMAADASPGELLFYLMIRKCNAEGVTLFDFGIGDQAYKRSWCTVETVQRDIVLPLTLRGRLAAGAHRTAVRMKVWIKKNRKAYAFLQRLRQQRQTPDAAAVPDTDGD
ncbi:CelD/BcsL family acetyltransferase involved in cellulose biosynthesis [Rhizobium herbae]|uniref:CelD/BcsL family acetyltransferase involved in cellulose biosynthesis n=2 Tax=Rhizobium herbae TaxID=508661 RepID=A0ABS4ESC3_9HYPH|nr:GNAT family N-acetyltransferase [Rhizobium herbae]MBP1860847.1 CelD/BcsL family acetyltransferase involved in cellulose biosynthesis [Rhizobium herbae]